MALIQALRDILERPTMSGVLTGMIVFFCPVWVAFLVGLIVGWAWKPKWAVVGTEKLAKSMSKSLDLWSASASSLSPSQPLKALDSTYGVKLSNSLPQSETQFLSDGNRVDKSSVSKTPAEYKDCSASNPNGEISNAVTAEDLHYLCQLVEMKDGGPPWIHMMDRATPMMSYQAWRRDLPTGPPQYKSSTIFENATPELVRDFFCDDTFRPRWDDMLASSTTVEECPTTGTMIVQWIRKFPFFCKDREYIIGRRVWESGRSYYCVTKGVPCSSIPRRDKPRRVDLYFSSFCVRAVESKRTPGQLTACEVLLFHYEDMGIPWEIAKLGVRKGMWGMVQKIEPGLRAYQQERAAGAPLSRSAFMASINMKISSEYLSSLGSTDDQPETDIMEKPDKSNGINIPKVLLFGGAVFLACSLDHGLVTKTIVFGVARRLANIGKRVRA